MRSVYVRISLWLFATLVLSLVAFLQVTRVVSFQVSHRTGQFGQLQSMELEQAREAYEAAGPLKLRAFIDRLERYLHGNHYLTDAVGRDLVTGQDRAPLLTMATSPGSSVRP